MSVRATGTALAALALLASAAPARAQISVGGDVSRYEMLYGTPVDVSIDDIVQGAASYTNRAVRTHGRLNLAPTSGMRAYTLRGMLSEIVIAPVPEIRGDWEAEAMRMIGGEVEITGLVFQLNTDSIASGQPAHGVQFWAWLGPPEKETSGEIKSDQVALERLVSAPGRNDGRTVRVVGKFRGRNLYGDLPARTQRSTSDWVIKDDLYAIWVTGKKPKGSGWELDSGLKRDTGKWIEVVGRPETVRGVTYLKAMRVSLTTAPTAAAEVKPPPPPPERPKKPPVIVFALPLDGESEVAQDSRFVVQFSKDMDEATFAGHVLLRYAGPTRPGDRGFAGLRLSYDRGRRALTVDPGDVLRPRRTVELILLPGIADIDGMTLIPRRPVLAPGDVVDVLRYRVGS